MPEVKECPMCGGPMRLAVSERPEHIPGVPQPRMHVIREWLCPECDYFEELLDE